VVAVGYFVMDERGHQPQERRARTTGRLQHSINTQSNEDHDGVEPSCLQV